MKKTIVLLLCLTILSAPVSALAEAVQPVHLFGSDVAPLSHEELEEIEGAYHAIIAAGVFGAAGGAWVGSLF